MIFPFSNSVRCILEKAGWSESRSFDTTEYETLLRNEGLEVFPCVVDFLRSFGGLEMWYNNPFAEKLGEYFEEYMHFKVDEAIEELHPGVIEKYAVRVGAPLCYIGYGYRSVLLMDDEGNGYGAFDSDLHQLGKSGRDMVETILTGREGRSIS